MDLSMQGALDRLSTLKESSATKIEVYARRCYMDFTNPQVLNWWKTDKHDVNVARAITRPFYDLVHSCSIPTGLISAAAFDAKKRKVTPTKDHCFRPQFVYRYMLDNHETIQGFNEFRQWFVMCCSTILVTGEENDRLSSEGTKNHGGDYVLLSPTNLQYQNADLSLYSYSDHRLWKDKVLTEESNLISPPQQLLQYETQYLCAS